jgi:hypothetical protein
VGFGGDFRTDGETCERGGESYDWRPPQLSCRGPKAAEGGCRNESARGGPAVAESEQCYAFDAIENDKRQCENETPGEDMTDLSKEAGVIMALEERFEKQRLPRLLSLKDKVDGGNVLDDADIEFLEQVINDAMHSKPLMDRHPEWQGFCAYVIHLYEEITEKALRNEEKS